MTENSDACDNVLPTLDPVGLAIEAIQEATAATSEGHTVTAELMAADRMRALIDQCSKGSRQQLTEARDKIDDLMRALDARGKLLADAVTEYSGALRTSSAASFRQREAVGGSPRPSAPAPSTSAFE